MTKKQTDIGRLRNVVFAFCKGVDTPRSLKLWLLVSNNEWDQVARFKVHPTEYLHHDSFMVDYAISNFLRKTEGLPKVCDTRAVAIQSFKKTEAQCGDTNQRIRGYLEGRLKPTDHRVEQVIHTAQRKIGNLLGVGDISDTAKCSWGNGATSDLSRTEAYLDDKMVLLPFSCTPAAWRHAARAIADDLHWKSAIVDSNPASYTGAVIDGLPFNVFDTVPKTILTDRCIAKEPRLNGFLQKGAGTFIRRKLRGVGIDLNDQSRNQALAGMARELGLCTVDLESASDTVATEVVRLLLPNPTFEYLNDIRSHYTKLDDDLVRLEKFSSMGNAFTFELESLIFWAVALSSSEYLGWSTVGVFGDDIIVRREAYPLLKATLDFLGFSINTEKTFVEGDFFESCGSHFFKGYNVTPIYQKCVPRSDDEAIRLCNRILRFALRLAGDSSLDKRIEAAWRGAVREYSIAKYRGPISKDRDDYLNVPRSGLNIPYKPNRGYRVKTVSEAIKWIPANDFALYSIWLRLSGTGEDPDAHRTRSAARHFKNIVGARLNEEGVIVNAIEMLMKITTPGEPGMILSRLPRKHTVQDRWVFPSVTPALDW